MVGINPLSKEVYLERRESRKSDIRGDYFRDQTAIIHSMPFRRLKNKTQVFFAPKNDHVCTRIEHVMHVATIAATICKGLNNNEWMLDTDLAYAIGVGHDLGHAPFGHAGETVLNEILKDSGGFVHEVNGYRTVEYLANDGKGLNLTYAVKDGIICHNGEEFEQTLKPITTKNNLDTITNRKCLPSSYEGCIVRIADKIAYLGRDIEDAIIADLIHKEDIPDKIRANLGQTNGEIIDTLVEDVIKYSSTRDEVGFSSSMHSLMKQLKDFNYKNIYGHKIIEEYRDMGQNILRNLYGYLLELYNRNGDDKQKYDESKLAINKGFGSYLSKMSEFYEATSCSKEQIVVDYIAGMTDIYALDCMQQITIPKPIPFGNS